MFKIETPKLDCSQETERSNDQWVNGNSDDGLVANRWQAITWSNDGLVYWCIYVSVTLALLLSNQISMIHGSRIK